VSQKVIAAVIQGQATAEWLCVLVKEISVATNERVSFTRSGMLEEGKRMGRRKINAMCAIMIGKCLL